MDQVVYNGDTRYPGPKPHPPPAFIKGIPSQQELDAYPRMFTWGELKEIIQTGELERLMRKKDMQARYDEWMTGIKVKYGSTENYLTRARLPWSQVHRDEPAGTYDLSTSPTLEQSSFPDPTNLTPSTNPLTHPQGPSGKLPIPGWTTEEDLDAASTAATPGGRGAPGGRSGMDSGTVTPSSAGFVSMASLRLVNGKLKASGSRASLRSLKDGGTGTSTPLRQSTDIDSPSHDHENGSALESRHPGTGARGARGEGLGDADDGDQADEGAEGEVEGEGAVYLKWDDNGLDDEKYAVLPNDWPYNIPYGVRHYCVWSRVPIAHPELVDYDAEAWLRIEKEGLGGFTGITPLKPFQPISPPPTAPLTSTTDTSSKTVSQSGSSMSLHKLSEKNIGKLDGKSWYAADVAYAGAEMRRWAGVGYESKGGEEVGKMVRGLWDPKGWECLWFVNPPRLQSVPGFSHFHVFARRKTPEEIDASEGEW